MKSQQKKSKSFCKWKCLIIHDQNRIVRKYDLDDEERHVTPIKTSKRRNFLELRKAIEAINVNNIEKNKECLPLHQNSMIIQSLQSKPKAFKKTRKKIEQKDNKIDKNSPFTPKEETTTINNSFSVSKDNEIGNVSVG